jgi:hypothetical protein
MILYAVDVPQYLGPSRQRAFGILREHSRGRTAVSLSKPLHQRIKVHLWMAVYQQRTHC